MIVPVTVINGEFLFRCPICSKQVVATRGEAKTECLHPFSLLFRGDVATAEFEI